MGTIEMAAFSLANMGSLILVTLRGVGHFKNQHPGPRLTSSRMKPPTICRRTQANEIEPDRHVIYHADRTKEKCDLRRKRRRFVEDDSLSRKSHPQAILFQAVCSSSKTGSTIGPTIRLGRHSHKQSNCIDISHLGPMQARRTPRNSAIFTKHLCN